jgi:hypothetical protein
VVRFESFRVCALGSWVIGANMQCKLRVALQLEVAHQFIERCASGRARGFEPPATFGATKTPKTLLVNPHQGPPHGRLCRCAPTLSDRMPGIRLSFKGRRVQVRRNDSFRSGVLADGTRKPSPGLGVGGKCIKGRAKCTCVNFRWSVGHPTYMGDFCRANARFRGLV